MPHQCRVCSKTNPPAARFCYFDGTSLNSKVEQGPVQMGSLPFQRPFCFSDGQECENFNQLALACDNHWDEARTLLTEGIWATFFGGLGRIDLALAAQQAVREPDLDRGLSELLQKFPADTEFLRPAKLALESTEENLGQLTPGSDVKFDVMIVNRGSLLLHGVVWSDCDWLAFGDYAGMSQKVFQTRDFHSIPMRVLGDKLHAGARPIKGEIHIETNGGDITLPVRAEVPIQPFPMGAFGNDSLAGATSPRELALKAKANINQAAQLFEQGEVRRWYAANGWAYPIEGQDGMGKAAVQQFFEALGLTLPPKLEVIPRFLVFKGAIGERISRNVTVSTEESKPVYAQAWCDQQWVQIGEITFHGKKVKIPVDVVIPEIPGETVQANITVRGNGNQQFDVPLNVSASHEYAPVTNNQTQLGDEIEEGASWLSNPMTWVTAGAIAGMLLLFAVAVGLILLFVFPNTEPVAEDPDLIPEKNGQVHFIPPQLKGNGQGGGIGTPPADNQVKQIQLKNDKISLAEQLADQNNIDQISQKPCRIYQVQLNKDNTYVLALESIDFKPYLRLEDAAKVEQAADKKQFSAFNAKMHFKPPQTGVYRIVASTFDRTGIFGLSIEREDAAAAGNWLNTVYGNWHIWKHDDGGVLLVSARSKQAIHFHPAFLASINYRDANGKMLNLYATGNSENSKKGIDNLDAFLAKKPNRLLANGDYSIGEWQIKATDETISFLHRNASAKSGLKLGKNVDQFYYGGKLYPKGGINGSPATPLKVRSNGVAISVSDLNLTDPLDRVTSAPCRVFKFPMTQGTNYLIDLKSNQFNPVLRLEDATGKQLALGRGSLRSSQLRHFARQTGDYYIIVSAIGRAAGKFYLWVQQEEDKIIKNDNEFFTNGAKFGIWSLWAGPLQSQSKSSFLLIEKGSGQAIYIGWNYEEFFYYRDRTGQWHVVSKSGQKARANAMAQRFCENVMDRPEPLKKLMSGGKYRGGNWKVHITEQRLEFERGANSVSVAPLSEGFTYNGKTYGLK